MTNNRFIVLAFAWFVGSSIHLIVRSIHRRHGTFCILIFALFPGLEFRFQFMAICFRLLAVGFWRVASIFCLLNSVF
jgi:hypothetical protein